MSNGYIKFTIVQIVILFKNVFQKSANRELKQLVKESIKTLLIASTEFLINYDSKIKGLSKLTLYLEEEFSFERKRSYKLLTTRHEPIVFNICPIDDDKLYIEDYFTKFSSEDQNQEMKLHVFMFNHLTYLHDKFMLKGRKRIFYRLYEDFYSQFKSLQYKVDQCYNIKDAEFFKVWLKIKVGNKLFRKLW